MIPNLNKAWLGDGKFLTFLRDIILVKKNTFFRSEHVSYAFNMLVEKILINDETGSS